MKVVKESPDRDCYPVGEPMHFSKSSTVGTLIYLPPEVFFKKREGEKIVDYRKRKASWAGYDPFKIDAFSLGCILFELTQGRRLFNPIKGDTNGFLLKESV